jgi:archaellum biogenesis ATPase FlaH
MSRMDHGPGIRGKIATAEAELGQLCEAFAKQREAMALANVSTLSVSASDRKLHVTLFENPYAFTKTENHLSIREIERLVRTTRAASKKRLPLLKLGRYGDEANSANCLRTNANFLCIDGVEVDYDGEELPLRTAVTWLEQAGLCACIYETASSTPESPRYRILCPLSETLPVEKRAGLVARLQGLFKGALATESFIPSLAFFFGAVDGQRRPEVFRTEGRFLDEANELDAEGLGANGQLLAGSITEATAPSADQPHEPVDLDRIERALEAFPPELWENRDFWLRLMISVKRAAHGSEDSYDLFARYSELGGDKHDPDDQRRVWDSINLSHPDGIGPGTLFYEASKYPRLLVPHAGVGLEILSVEDCLAAPPRDYVLKGFLLAGDLCSVFGPPGAGKSTLCPYLAYHVATGREVFGLRVKQGLVFYVVAEDEDGMPRRVAALASRHGSTDQFRVIRRVRTLFDEDGSDLAELLALAREHRPSLIVIDTLAAAFPGLVENESKDMSRVISAGRALTNCGAAVIIVHHDAKQKGDTPRGHSSFNGILDSAMHLKRGQDGVVSGELTKNRAGPLDIDFSFKVESEFISKDADGDDLTAPVVAEVLRRKGKFEKALTPAQYHALRVLDDLTVDSPDGVSREVWRDRCIESGLVSTADARAGQRRGVNMAIAELLRGKHVQAEGDLLIRSTRSVSGIFDDEPEVTSEPTDEK